MITKSDYTNFIRCPVLYYLRKFHKDLEAPLSIVDETNIKNGFTVGKLAQDYFKNNYVIDRENKSKDELYNETLKAIKDGNKIISEASFIYKDLFCAVDILKINDDNSVSIYEVKSAKSLDDIYYDDASFQSYVLRNLGYKVKEVFLMHPNPKYVFKDEFDINGYFELLDVKEKINVKENLDLIREINTFPNVEAISDCSKCGFFKSHCFKDLSSPNVFELSGLKNRPQMYNSGVHSFEDYLKSDFAKGATSDTARKAIEQAEFAVNNLPIKIDKPKVQKFLNKLEYPLYYLDFETVKDIIPFINGTTIAFPRIMQFSLHIKDTPNSKVRHEEYLQDRKYDNLQEVADELIKYLGDKGSILVYSSFENSKISKLMELVPSRRDKLRSIKDRLLDMAEPFQKRYVYCQAFKGRYTIKYVLPALCPEFDKAYAELPMVHNGGQIDDAYDKLVNSTGEEHEQIKDAMLKYCCLDTLAEVKIIEKLYEFVK